MHWLQSAASGHPLVLHLMSTTINCCASSRTLMQCHAQLRIGIQWDRQHKGVQPTINVSVPMYLQQPLCVMGP